MIDGVPSASGQGYLIKSIASFLASYPTYSDFVSALVAGTLPIDISFNSAGWSTQPTPLNKANLLDDTVAAALKTLAGLSSDPATPNAAISALAAAVAGGAKIATGSYTGNGLYGSSHPCSLTFGFPPKMLYVEMVGATRYPACAILLPAAGRGFGFEVGDSTDTLCLWSSGSTYNAMFTNSVLSIDQSVTWYGTQNADQQLNVMNRDYGFVALG